MILLNFSLQSHNMWDTTSVIRLGHFWKFFPTNLPTKVAQKERWLLGLFWINDLFQKLLELLIMLLLETFGLLFYFDIWSHWTQHSVSFYEKENSRFQNYHSLQLDPLCLHSTIEIVLGNVAWAYLYDPAFDCTKGAGA